MGFKVTGCYATSFPFLSVAVSAVRLRVDDVVQPANNQLQINCKLITNLLRESSHIYSIKYFE